MPSFLLPIRALLIAFLLIAAAQAAEPQPSAPLPEGYELLYATSFDEPESLADYEFSDPKAWKLSDKGRDGGGALELVRQSKYEPPVRSPLNIALLSNHAFGDFVLEADLVQTGREYGHRDMCLFFGFTDPAKFYYTHIATTPDPAAHNLFIVDDEPRKNFAKEISDGVDWGLDKWHTVRLERDTQAGTIRVFFDDMTKPILAGEDKTFVEGCIGFGSFDDKGKIDNVRIWGPSVKERSGKMFGE